MKFVESADSAIAAADYVKAITSLQKALRSEPANPNNLLLLSNLGMLNYYIGNDSVALATLNIAHDLAPSSVTVLLNRAKVNNGIGNFAEALLDYTEVTQLDSTLVDPWIQKGMLQLKGGDVRGAEAAIARATAIEPDSKETILANALLYSKTNRPKEAIPLFNKLIKNDPQSEYYAERGMCYLRLDDLAAASEDIAKGLELDASNPDLYITRALLNRRRFRENDAKADAAHALKLGASQALLKAMGF